jgi:hypothetical protein
MPIAARGCPVGVDAGVGRGAAGPAKGKIVLTRKAGCIVDRKTGLIGEDAGKVGYGSVGGAVGGRRPKDNSSVVVVRLYFSGVRLTAADRDGVNGFPQFRAILGDDP